MIENFLTHHKRLCPANRGRDCACGLFQARKDLRFILETFKETEALLDGPIADLMTGDAMSETGAYIVLENVRIAIARMEAS